MSRNFGRLFLDLDRCFSSCGFLTGDGGVDAGWVRWIAGMLTRPLPRNTPRDLLLFGLPRAGEERLRVRVEGEPLLVRVVEPMPADLLPARGLVDDAKPRELVEPLVWGCLDPSLGDRPRPVILSRNGEDSLLYHLIKVCKRAKKKASS